MKAVIYLRYSPRRNAANCESCETQLEFCEAWCKFKQLEVIGVFRDEGVSGKTTKRPGLDQALKLVKAEKATLVVHSLSRLARNTRAFLELVDDLKKAKADFKAVKDGIDTSGPFGRVMLTIRAAFDQLEREQISERTSEAMHRHQRTGRRMSKLPPYGTQIDPADPARLIPNKMELGMIERAKVLRTQEFTLKAIADTLEAEGFKPRKVKRDGVMVPGSFHPEKIKRILNAIPLDL